eukprot:m.198369 g.198369  ORF g.198369 m.198369 type:complete len:437 (+) comp18745_c0_seq1:160-1470(+)
MSFLLGFFIASVAVFGACAGQKPQQTHIALTENPGQISVTFVTTPANGSHTGEVAWGTESGKYTSRATASTHTYTDGGFDGIIFSANMSDLVSDTTYYYAVSVGGVSSNEFKFSYRPTADQIRFLSYGDMGIKNSWGTATLAATDAASGLYDLTVNVGDISYADDYEYGHNAHVLDTHFNEVEAYAAAMPFMTVPGNHEAQYHFAGYLNRLRMPVVGSGPLNRFYYSFNYGPVHFVVYSSEHPFDEGSEQWEFIKNDLEAASAPAQRARTPWIIMWSHRPLYCSDLGTWEERCVHEAAEYRANIEAMMVKASVDLHISGHNHQYERSYPVHGCSKDYSTGCAIVKSYHNAPSPVYIVNGAAGDVEGTDPTWVKDEKVPFRATNDDGLHTGYARVTVNRTTLDWQFVYSGSRAIPGTNASDMKDAGTVRDRFLMTKD